MIVYFVGMSKVDKIDIFFIILDKNVISLWLMMGFFLL